MRGAKSALTDARRRAGGTRARWLRILGSAAPDHRRAQQHHDAITKAWAKWKDGLKGAVPSAAAVESFAQGLDNVLQEKDEAVEMTAPSGFQGAVVEYSDDDDFAERIGKLILSGIPIRMALRGKYRDLLVSHTAAGSLVDPAHIGTIPSLQTFVAAVMLAAGAEQPVSYSTQGNAIVVSIGYQSKKNSDGEPPGEAP